ncbi:MAG TPA: hypothetical protein VMD74_02455 [Candidatus Methylomirabilis sp.]|nr:hypothetical protein [Candidatus Methylomirabilis sp.]
MDLVSTSPKAIKLNQLTTGVLFLLAAIVFILIFLAATLVPTFYQVTNVASMVLLPLLFIFFVEGAMYWVFQSAGINEEKMRGFGRKNFVSQTASALALLFAYGSLIKNIIFILLVLGFATFIADMFIIVPISKTGLALSVNFYAQLGVYFVWFIILRKFIISFLYRVEGAAKKNLPFYSLDADGLIFNFNVVKGAASAFVLIAFLVGTSVLFLPQQYKLYAAGVFILCIILAATKVGSKVVFYPVKIKFEEIDEIREVNYVEAQSLMKYQIGPNISLATRGAKDMYDFMKKKIEKPNVYVMMPAMSGAKTLVIKGQNIFYLSAVQNENFEDLLNAFEKYKSQGQSLMR